MKDVDVKAREALRRWLIIYTEGCKLQKGKDNKPWPCGTCTVTLFERIGLCSKNKDYRKHNKPVDRINEIWRAFLQIREA